MKSTLDPGFHKFFAQLPKEVQDQAREAYRRFRQDPLHPGLQFKRIRGSVYSIRINQDYRALGERDKGEIIWFWIGPHDKYDKLLK